MTYTPSIAERIAWTSGRLWSAGTKVLLALASCGDWNTGQRCHPSVETIVTRSGLSRATVTRTLKRLRDEGWIIRRTWRRRHATTYDICVDRLATGPLKAQQVNMTITPPELEAQNEPSMKLEAQNEPQPPKLEAQNEPPISLSGSDLHVHTDTRAREDAATQPELAPLVGSVPWKRCLHPHAHGWCGRVCVPKGLHFELLDKLDTQPGESRSAKVGRLVAWYAATMHAIPPEQPIGEAPYPFWRAAFAQWVAPAAAVPTADSIRLTRRDLDEARHMRTHVYNGCPHDPRCASYGDCLQAIAEYLKYGTKQRTG